MGTKVKTCVVVGASPTTDSAFIKPILKQADYIICADGGWNHVYRTGVSPHLIYTVLSRPTFRFQFAELLFQVPLSSLLSIIRVCSGSAALSLRIHLIL